MQLTPTPSTRPTGRGLGRRVADIVMSNRPDEVEGDPGPIIAGPLVLPFEAVPVPMLIADPAGDVMAANVRWVQLSGLSTTASLGGGWLSVLTQDSGSKLRADVRRVADHRTGATVDYSCRAAPGQRWRWWLQPYERAGERLVCIAVADINDHQKRKARPCPQADLRSTLAGLPDLFDELDEILGSIDRLARSKRL
ncbi:MAG: PAS domain-containing protein [Acidimicrobiales bacterium]|nr:PAS domain-containing protein [Acidimicrobiales bacterium]